MRFALILLGIFLARLAAAADILIFVQEKEAGPIVSASIYRHPTWILWPHSSNLLQTNRFLSIPSGVDWNPSRIVDPFVVVNGYAQSIRPEALVQQGYFDAVRQNLGKKRVYALAPVGALPSSDTLRAAWTKPDGVHLVTRKEEWPYNSLVVASVTGRNPWDEKAVLVRKAGGRALIIEVPTSSFTMWSRVWLEGTGWPDGLPCIDASRIPGLIPARHAMALLANPTQWRWTTSEPVDPPNRWLNFGHSTTPVVLVFLAVASLYVLGLSVFYVLREQYARLALWLLRLMVISPAALILGGFLTSFGAVANWPTWHLAALFLLAVGAFAINRGFAKWLPECHPLLGEFSVGLIAIAAVDPAWSMFSHVLGDHPARISPEAFGALATYAVGVNCLFAGKGWQTSLWSLTFLAGSAILLYHSGWIPLSPTFIAVLAIPVLQPRVHDVKVLATLISFFLALSVLLSRGIAYAPNGLISNLFDQERINFADHVSFLFSPMFIGFGIALITIAIVGDNFLGHQIRRALAFSPKPRTFLYAAGTFGFVGLASPIYLHAALATAIAGGVAILFDAVRAP